MRVFFVCLRVPYPPDRGDKIATFNVIRHLAREHEVHVFCLGDGRRDLENIEALGAYAKSVVAMPISGIKGKIQAVKALFTGAPLSVAIFNQEKLHATIIERSVELKPDLIFVYSCNVAQFAEHFSDVPRIMHFSDLDSLKWTEYARRIRSPMKWIYRIEGRRLLEYERHIARTFSSSLVCTNVEKRDFERLIPGSPVEILANGIDLDFFRPQGRPKTPGSIVFTGVMDYFPNVDGVEWFCDAILPAIRDQIPHAQFTICGSRPNAAVARLAQRPGVTVTGRVADVRPYLDAAEVAVVPLRIARGIQNKLLEALAMGVPCVSTAAAWSGTAIPNGDGILAADDPRDFADCVVRLLRNHVYRSDMATKARSVVEASFTWDTQLSTLDRLIAELTNRPPPGVGAARASRIVETAANA